MKTYPSIPRIADAPDGLFDSGHLWLLEKVDGAHLRFQLTDSGAIRFGDRTRVYDDPDAIPEPYGHAVRHVRECFDRAALRNAVDDVESVVFFGEATHRHAIEYDWDRLPSFLGFDVWSETDERFRPPGAVQGIFERLGLDPVNAIERERNTRDFDASSYSVPDSAWYDGPAEGVVVRNKRGGRAKILHPEFRGTGEPTPDDISAAELAERCATDRRFGKLEAELTGRGTSVTFESLYDLAVVDIVREEHGRLYGGSASVDVSEFRSALAPRVRAFLDENAE